MSSNKVAQLYLVSKEAIENVNNVYLVYRNVNFRALISDCEIDSYYVLNLVSLLSETTTYGLFTIESNGMIFHNIDLINQSDTEYKIKNRAVYPFFGTSGVNYATYGIPVMFKLTSEICDIVVRVYLQANDYTYTEANLITDHSYNFDIYKLN